MHTSHSKFMLAFVDYTDAHTRGGDGTPKVGVLVGMACDHTRMHVI